MEYLVYGLLFFDSLLIYPLMRIMIQDIKYRPEEPLNNGCKLFVLIISFIPALNILAIIVTSFVYMMSILVDENHRFKNTWFTKKSDKW